MSGNITKSESIPDEELEDYNETEKKIIRMLAPVTRDGEKEYPEMNVNAITERTGKTRPYISKVLNQLYRDGVLERNEKKTSNLYSLSEDQNIGGIANIIKEKQEDIEAINEYSASDVTVSSIINNQTVFGSINFHFYADKADENPRNPLSQAEVDKDYLRTLLEKDQVRVSDIVNLLSAVVRDHMEEKWREELSDRYDNLLEEKSDRKTQEVGKELKDSIIDIVWNNQGFKTKIEAPETELEFPSNNSKEYEDAWEMVAGLTEPEEFQKLRKMKEPEELINQIVEEYRKIREYTIVMSERLNS